MKKILFIMDHYPNTRSTNSLCCEKLISLMQKCDISITCLVKLGPNLPIYEVADKVSIYRIHKSCLYKWYQWSRLNTETILSKAVYMLNRIILRLKQIVFIPIYPCLTPLFMLRLYKKALKIHRQEHFDAVISEHYSFESLVAGHLLKKKCKDIVFIPYFLDSLSGGFNAKYLPDKYCLRKKLSWERHLVSNAEKIIVMKSSKEHHERYSKNEEYFDRIRFLDIPLLEDIRVSAGSDLSLIESDRINVVFSGYLNKFDRDPTYIINLFNMLNRDDITLVFIGAGNCQQILIKAKETFKGHIIVSKFVNHDKLVGILSKATVFLNFGVSNSNAISGKIFEYMSFGKPIISTYYIDKEACIPYLEKYPLSLLIDQREQDLSKNAAKLESFLNNNLGKSIPFDEIKRIFYENTPEAFVSILKDSL